MKQAQLIIVTRMQSSEGLRFLICQAQAQDHGIEDCVCSLVQLPEELGGVLAEPRKNIFGQPDIVLNLVLFTSDLVALLDEG